MRRNINITSEFDYYYDDNNEDIISSEASFAARVQFI